MMAYEDWLLPGDITQDTRKKMREVIAIRLTNASLKLADMVIDGDENGLKNFLVSLQKAAVKKYSKYLDPEKFTDTEKKTILAVSEKMGYNYKIHNDYIAAYVSTEQTEWELSKQIVQRGKMLQYVITRGSKRFAESKPFDAAKKQDIRELARILKIGE